MLALLNLSILVFVLAMAGYWGMVQGWFSGLLHLVATIAAGAIALALWEPVVYGLLIDRMPAYAWSVGLIGPFVLLLILIRVILDFSVKVNAILPAWINAIGGGVCGLIAGVLTAGLTLIGLNYMTFDKGLMGYQPLTIQADGQLTGGAGDSLWLAVDQRAGDFFAGLSNGAFYAGRPMAQYLPAPARQPLVLTAGQEFAPHSFTAASPTAVALAGAWRAPLPLAGVDADVQAALKLDQAPEQSLLLIDTEWTPTPGTFDPDGALRLAPPAIQLVTWHEKLGQVQVQIFSPVAVSKPQPTAGHRVVQVLNTTAMVSNAGQGFKLGWVFIIPREVKPQFLMVRNLRLPITGVTEGTEGSELAIRVGRLPEKGKPATTVVVDPTKGATGTEAKIVEITNRLPKEISINRSEGLTISDKLVREGSAIVAPPTEVQMSGKAVIGEIAPPAGMAVVRVQVAPDKAQSIFGKVRSSALALQPVYLSVGGQQILPFAYVRLMPDGKQAIAVRPIMPFQSAQEMNVSELMADDQWYVYFAVPHGSKVLAYHLGRSVRQDVNLDVP